MSATGDTAPDAATEASDLRIEDLQIESATTKSKSKSKRKKKKRNDPSGFEEYYVDPPITAEEHKEEQGLYNPLKSFPARIQSAINRYTSRRKFNADRNHVWTMYLRFGGIEAGPKMFGGSSAKDLADKEDPEEGGDLETLKAREFVMDDVYDDQFEHDDRDAKYVVDFDGVARAFFSMHLPSAVSTNTQEILKTYTGMVRNWLNYLLQHDVCNEYRDQVLAARETCDMAEKQLWAIHNLNGNIQGQFGEACRKIFLSPMDNPHYTWDWSDTWTIPTKVTSEEANRIFLVAMAALGSDELIDRYQEQNQGESGTAVLNSMETGLEIIDIPSPTSGTLSVYNDDAAHGLGPLYKVHARTWYMDWDILPDLTEEEEAALPHKRAEEQRNFELWVDENCYKHAFVGLKMTVILKELNFGLCFLDRVSHIFPSFVTWLPNELMMGYREHEWIPPNREKLLDKLNAFSSIHDAE